MADVPKRHKKKKEKKGKKKKKHPRDIPLQPIHPKQPFGDSLDDSDSDSDGFDQIPRQPADGDYDDSDDSDDGSSAVRASSSRVLSSLISLQSAVLEGIDRTIPDPKPAAPPPQQQLQQQPIEPPKREEVVKVYEAPDLLPPKVARRKYPHRYANIHEPQQEDHIGHTLTYELRSSWFLFRVFLSVLDWSAFAIMMLSCGITILCMHFKWFTDMPLSLLASGIIFPISFSISYSSSRRERVLLDIASLKASMVALYQLHRDWELAFTKPKRKYSQDCKMILETLVEDIEVYIQHQGGKERLHRIYQNFDELSRIHENLRREEDWVKSLLSRCYQYERYMINDFERLRVIHDFRTAATLRGYGFIFLYGFPILLAPLFAYYAHNAGTWAGIFISIVSSFMVVSLYRVSVCMEDPFDEIGVDDVNLGILSESLRHMFD